MVIQFRRSNVGMHHFVHLSGNSTTFRFHIVDYDHDICMYSSAWDFDVIENTLLLSFLNKRTNANAWKRVKDIVRNTRGNFKNTACIDVDCARCFSKQNRSCTAPCNGNLKTFPPFCNSYLTHRTVEEDRLPRTSPLRKAGSPIRGRKVTLPLRSAKATHHQQGTQIVLSLITRANAQVRWSVAGRALSLVL